MGYRNATWRGAGDVQSQGTADGTGRGHARCGRTAMTGTLFALAFLSALHPKLFAVDLVLIESARPRQRPGRCAPGRREAGSDPLTNLKPPARTDSSSPASGYPLGASARLPATRAWR